jgi:subfamily B ATP-binding cassette protein MsbA
LPPEIRRGLARRIISDHVVHYWPPFARALLLMAMVAVATAGLAKMMEPVLDEVFEARNTAALPWVVGLIFGLFVVKGMANYGQVYVMEQVSQRIVDDIRKRLFAHLLTLDVAFFSSAATSDLVSRILNDVMALRQAVGKALTSAGKDALTLILLIGVMIWQDPVLAGIAFFVFPTAFYPVYRIGRRIRRLARELTDDRAASTLEGGYNLAELPRCLEAYLAGLGSG